MSYNEMKTENSAVIAEACRLISNNNLIGASQAISSQYPFLPFRNAGRSYTPKVMTKIFLRDGFIDRYRGTKLVFPPVLRLLSHYLPTDFPYHKNSKMSEGHIAYWELFPTIDHIVPIARGGADSEENWICCSMLTNSIKSNWTLEQLQWTVLPKGSLKEWDGMACWFLRQVEKDPAVLQNSYIKRWHSAALELMHNNLLTIQ